MSINTTEDEDDRFVKRVTNKINYVNTNGLKNAKQHENANLATGRVRYDFLNVDATGPYITKVENRPGTIKAEHSD